MDDIKRILDSEAGFLIEDFKDQDSAQIIDNRFELLKSKVDSKKNKDDNFYTELISLISNYFDVLYDSTIENYNFIVLSLNEELIPQEDDCIGNNSIFKICRANRKLATELFDYVCDILENNKDIKLDYETLKRLLNRAPKSAIFSVEEAMVYRMFHFNKLSKIINDNQILKKSNISLDEVYQILIDTGQLDNNFVVTNLIKPEEFQHDHKKIDELLMKCNAKAFVDITNVIIKHFDKNYDRLSIVKKRNSNNFIESVLKEVLQSISRKEDYDFIHKLLTDKSININYDLYCSSYLGQTTLKELIALSGNKIIIKDLLNKKENIQDNYWHGESKTRLYRLYAIIGEYEKALINFEERYNYAYDFAEDFSNGFNKDGYAEGDMMYKDSLIEFLKAICNSCNNENINYLNKKALIIRILNSDKVKFINLEKLLPIMQENLSVDDFKLLLDGLMEKFDAGLFQFTTVTEQDGYFDHYIITIASKGKVQDILFNFNRNEENEVLSLKKIKCKKIIKEHML